MPTSVPGRIKVLRRLRARWGGAAYRAPARGFTLIEVLVVLVILGVVATVTTLSLEGVRIRSQDDEIKRLRIMLERAADRAQISSRLIAVDFLPHSYRFSELDTGENWRLMFEPRDFAERMWRSPIEVVSVEVDGQPVKPPQRIVFSSETPEYVVRLKSESGTYVLTGTMSGAVSLEPALPASS